MKKIKNIFILIIFFIFLIEFFSLLASKLNLLVVNFDPNYIKSYGNNWRTETELWGSWHKKNFKDKQSTECFNVEYQSNNIGARDNKDYNYNDKKPSIIFLGDSFAEGYGVDINYILPKLLEKKLEKNVLNFGSSGHFGPLQSQIIYSNLASKFTHDEIIYLFYPANDFTDNYWDYWKKKIRKFRNRPYFLKNANNNFDIFYPSNPSNKIKTFLLDLIYIDIKTFLLKYTYTANTLRSINYLIDKFYSQKDLNLKKINSLNNSYFFNDQLAIEGTLNSINKLFLESKKVEKKTLIIIPNLEDMEMIKNKKEYKNLKWYKDLSKIINENNVFLLDIADFTTFDEYKKFIFSCDQHWNKDGHQFVLKLLLNNAY